MTEKNHDDFRVSKKLKTDADVEDLSKSNSHDADAFSRRKPIRFSMEHDRRRASSALRQPFSDLTEEKQCQ